MTTRRIRIAANDASPFRVSASGIDVNGATFDGLLFDGNQSPLRLYASGYMLATPITAGSLEIVVGTPGPFGPSVSSGQHSLFTIVYRHQTSPTPPLRTAFAQGGCGGAMDSSNRLHALNFFGKASPDLPDSYVNYMIFRNAG
jgi:hypothetical protein